MQSSEEGMLCIYCLKRLVKPSLEHIWPDKLGGDFGPPLFRTQRVCQRCNNIAGLFADGEFTRSQISSWELHGSSIQFIDPKKVRPVPLVYMGQRQELELPEGLVCECWLGPCGEHMHYFHPKDEYHFETYSGGNPIARKRKKDSRVYVSFTRPNPFWVLTATLSAEKWFKHSKIHSLTELTDAEFAARFADDDSTSEKHRALIGGWEEPKVSVKASMNMDHGLRFMCKLALGLGFKLYGENFLDQKHTARLSATLFEGDPIKREQLGVRWTPSFTDGDQEMSKMCRFDGGYVLAFYRAGSDVILLLCTPMGRTTSVLMTDAADQLPRSIIEEHGGTMVLVIVPEAQAVLGAFNLTSYVMHTKGYNCIAELKALEEKRQTRDQIEKAVEMHWPVDEPHPSN